MPIVRPLAANEWPTCTVSPLTWGFSDERSGPHGAEMHATLMPADIAFLICGTRALPSTALITKASNFPDVIASWICAYCFDAS